jgi:uncharacterized Ntn-hydrolase superfamily protein
MTWSILARDPATGALGAAVASRFFAVGAICITVESRVGAMSTQALVNPLHTIAAMPRLRDGDDPEAIVDALLHGDPGRSQRQVHMLDAQGRIAQHSGPDCIDWAGTVKGENVSVAGNMLAGPEVVRATTAAFGTASGSFAERLLTAMEAGEAAGGDKRGRQSAALKIATADPYPDLDIRADDHPDPLAELRRLHRVSLVRYAVLRRHMPGTAHPWGTIDRAITEAAVAAHGRPLP